MSNNLPTTRRLGDLIGDVVDKRLIVRPFFQRRQVWNNSDKEHFIDTILNGYPFPEVFVAEGKREGASTGRIKVLVDGQQRLSTVIAYVEDSDEFLYKTIKRYSQLEQNEKDGFLDYVVAVRDLGTASNEVVREIFNRINSTDYALKSMEILNAMFSGPYKSFCEQLSRDPFFEKHKTFPKGHQKRMRDVNFCVILVTTFLSGYYNRDERNSEYLGRYNEEFAEAEKIRFQIDRAFDFIERCEFSDKSRVWKQTDLFTLLVELNSAISVKGLSPEPEKIGPLLEDFYAAVDELFKAGLPSEQSEVPQQAQKVFAYLKAATKATNDKYSRVERANIIAEFLQPDSAAIPLTIPQPPKSRKRRSKKA